MYQFWPARIPDPEGTAANATESSLARAFIDGPGLFIPDFGVKYGDVFFAVNLQRRVIRAKVNRISATARRLPTDRAITKVKWVRVRRQDIESHGPAVT